MLALQPEKIQRSEDVIINVNYRKSIELYDLFLYNQY
jgi:hypothetical protein